MSVLKCRLSLIFATTVLSASFCLAEHTAHLESVLSGKCVEIPNSSNQNGVDAVQQTCDGGANQTILFTPTANIAGVFRLRMAHSSKCLEMAGGSSGADVSQASCDGGTNQQFEFVATPDGNYEIIPRNSGLRVSLQTASGSNGVKLEQHPDADADHQRWRVANADGRDPSVYGRWSNVIPWPHIAVSAANLPDGRVLTFSGSERETWPSTEFTYSSTWDPAGGTFVEIDHLTHNMFCSHLAMTEDGQVFVNGGRNQTNSPWTSLFDYSNNQWKAIENMATGGRWYPTTLALTDGDMFTAVGTATNQRNPERWDSQRGWSVLTGIDFQTPILDYGSSHGEHRWWTLLHVAPQGKIFHSGPLPTVGWINPTGSGSYEDSGIRLDDWYHKHGTTMMYDVGKIITAGGWISGGNTSSSDEAFTIDLNGPTPVVQNIDPMHHRRKFHNGIMLPTGEVLVIGGNTSGQKFSDNGAVHAVEIWNPSNGQWREGAEMTIPRNYHSVGLLLTDGRVLSAGGGYCDSSEYCGGASHPDGELYSPPYLFESGGSLAARPAITSAPGMTDNGSVFDVQTSGTVDYFSMIKMGATTHGVNTDVRFLRVPSQDLGGGVYRLTTHGNPNVLTPGYWMLFAVDTSGVPSEAHVVRITNLDVQFDNVALLGSATQSSTLSSGFDLGPANALDGDQTGTDESGSLTQTQAESNAWWELNLHTRYDVDSIRLWNRTDCCGERLSDFYVLVSDDSFVSTDLAASRAQAGVSEYHVSSEVPGQLEITVGRTAQFVRVQLAGTDYLSLAEVQVFGEAPGAGTPGLIQYDYYEGTFNAVPDFGTLVPLRSGTLDGFDLTPRLNDNYFAFRFYGRITIPADGTYTFYTTSDAGSRLWIDGQLVVNNDGVHSSQERQGSLALTTGLHDILVGYFERTGGQSLVVSYQGPGIAKQEIPTGVLALLPQPGGSGAIEREWWTGIAGVSVSDLTADPDYPDSPDGSDERSSFEAPINWADNYGTRMRGFLYPPFSGMYTFWISSDDGGELWLSTDEQPSNVQLVAWVPGWSSSREWDKFPEQESAPVFLQSGQRYYIEALQKEQGGGDNLAVAWQTPFADRQVIGGEYLTPPFTELEVLGVASPPQVVTAPVTLVANASGDDVTYSWSFGDGTPDTPFDASSIANHIYPGPGRYTGTLTVRDVWGSQESVTFRQLVHAPLTASPPNASSTIVYHAGRAEVWNVNPDNDSVAVIDANSDVLIAEIPVGDEPRSLTVAVDGRVWVANEAAATLSVIDPSTQQVDATVALARGSRPAGIVADRTAPDVYVTMEATGEIVRFDTSSATEVSRATLEVGIRDIAITADGSQLLVSQFITPAVPGESTAAPTVAGVGGVVLRVNPADLSLLGTVTLQHSNRLASEHTGPGLPNYLQAAVISPDGANAWVPSKQDNILRGMLRDGTPLVHDQTVRAISSRIVLPGGTELFGSRIDHDNASIASSVAFGPYGVHLFTALEGNRQVVISDAHLGSELVRFPVGRAPHGLAVSPSGNTLYVHNFMDRSVEVVDISELTATGSLTVFSVATLSTVGTETLAPDVLLGKQLFYDASDPRLAAESYMACASCHFAGGHDGRTWDFTGFGEGLRNTITLRGRGGTAHGPLHWTANFDEIQDFENQIRSFALGSGLMSDTDFLATEELLGPPKAGLSADLDALASYVASLTPALISPHRDSGGNLTPQAESGRQLFRDLDCNGCHNGLTMTDSAPGVRHDVGTLKPSSGDRMGGALDGLDTPSLVGAWNAPPYLHDGSEATLEGAIVAHTGNEGLTQTERDQLVAYLEQVEAGDEDECSVDSDCDDGLFCNGAEACNTGTCQAGVPVDCDDGVACTADSCDEGGDSCQHAPVHSMCDDDLFCSGLETCDPIGGCQAGPDPCGGGLCDDGADVCVDCLFDSDCDDTLFCNGNETCNAGSCQLGSGPCLPAEVCDEGSDVCESLPVARLETGTVTVGETPITVTLTNTYVSPVVVCTVQYDDNTTPVVTRVTNVTANGFDVRLQSPSGVAVAADQVSYVVVEEGVWIIDGVKIEAQSYLSTVTDDNDSWVGEPRSYSHSYTNPVVLGQVMSENDPNWSVFWDRGATRTKPPSASVIHTGKTVGEDTITTRADETLGHVVIEAGHGTLGGVEFEARVGADTVQGVGNAPPYVYPFESPFSAPPQVTVATVAAMGGWNGGWVQAHGPTMATTTSLYLSIDEDTLADSERDHGSEQVGYLVFATPLAYEAPPAPGCSVDADCDDGLFCNGAETCDAGACAAGAAPDCDDAVFCTADSCDETADGCSNAPVDAVCDDGLFCTGVETCRPGLGCRGPDPCRGNEICNEGGNVCQTGGPIVEARLESGTVAAGGTPVTVDLTQVFVSPVVVCSVRYDDSTTPVVARVSNVTSTGFDVHLQRPSGGAVATEQVSYVVVEEGVWTIDGINIEAHTYLSTLTDADSSWVGERQSYGHSYAAPVVVGQVMTHNDPDWSVFWARGGSRTNPPGPSVLHTGKTVCEDSDVDRADETIGFIVIESGHGTIGGVELEAALGPDTVRGAVNSSPYAYTFLAPFPTAPQIAVGTVAGMNGGNGAWAQSHGPIPATPTTLQLSIDEDMIQDNERSHGTEQVGYVVFATPFSYPAAP